MNVNYKKKSGTDRNRTYTGKNERSKSAKQSKQADKIKQNKPTFAAAKAEANSKKSYSNTKKQKKTQSQILTQAQNQFQNKRNTSKNKPTIRIMFLGGLNEIGKNITLFECNKDIFILDCGMAFPDGDMLGVDLVIPDFTYVEENIERIKGIVITHGHEDHIGGLPFLLSKVRLPIYGTALTIGLIENKLKEYGVLSQTQLNVIAPGDTIKLGCMKVEFIHVNHSIPDSVAVAIHSEVGTIVHTGDFKIDCTPTTGGMIDLARFAELGKEGVLALLADSTNAEKMGYTQTEQTVFDSFERLFQRAEKKRIIIATFASNISRIQQIIYCAHKRDRKVAFSGRSMLNYIAVAQDLGYLDVPDGVIIDIDLLNRYEREKVVLVTTGSQGEPMSALSRMAYSDHKKVEVGFGDFIIISANPIPGNEKTVGNVVDELLKKGCEVVYESMYEVHVSGHACREELKIIHGLTKPKFFIPVHGEQKHLRKHAELALAMGMEHKNIFVGDIGNVVELNDAYLKQLPSIQAGKKFVDGLGVGDVGSIVLRDRKHLGQDGLVIIVATLDTANGNVISGPDIVSRGFVYVREADELFDEVRRSVTNVLDDCAYENIHDWGTIKNRVKDDVSKLIYDRTRRNPMILPIIMDV